jgi:two-component system response regulator YesN
MTKVLIVDDEMLMRKGLCTLIDWAALGCEVIGTAENGLRAKQVITSIQPDIVISDIKMPVVDGLALAKWVDDTKI